MLFLFTKRNKRMKINKLATFKHFVVLDFFGVFFELLVIA